MSSREDVVYTANLDSRQILSEIQKINRSLENIEKTGAQSFSRISESSVRAGVNMERFRDLADSLLETIVSVGVKIAEAFTSATSAGVALNSEAENLNIALTNIFSGNERAAQAFLDVIDKTALKIQADQTELRNLGKSILPDVGSIQGTVDLLETVIILARDAGAHTDDVRRTLEAALAGDFVGFQDVLNIPLESIRRIRELSKEVGTAEAITQVLGERIEKAGLSADAFADTFDAKITRIQSEGRKLTQILGESPFEALKGQADDLLSVFEGNKDDIEAVARAFGDFAADVIDFVGSGLTDFLQNIDIEGVERFADSLSDGLASLQLLADILLDPSLFDSAISGATKITELLDRAFTTAAQIGALAKAERARNKAEAAALESSIESVLGEVDSDAALLPGLTAKLGRLFADAETEAMAAAAGQEAYEESLRASLKSFDEQTEAQAENARQTEERRQITEAATQADLEAGEAELRRKKALEDLAKAQAEAAKEAAKATEAVTEAEEDLTEAVEQAAERRVEIAIRQEQRRTEALIQQSEKREAAELKSRQARDKILFKFDQDLAKLKGQDLSDEESKVARDGARKRAEIDRDSSKRRLDIERNFRRQLRAIQDEFNQTATEAERNNDAKAFLAAQRQLDQQRGQAERDRNDQLADASDDARQQRKDLQIELNNELQDVRENNRKKIAELQIRLDEELALHEFSRQQEAERQALAEQQELDRLTRQHQIELENFDRKEAEKRAKLQASLDEQLAIIDAAKQKELELFAKAEEEKAKIQQNKQNELLERRQKQFEELNQGGTDNIFGVNTTNRPGQIERFQHGGQVAANQAIIVGEAGPELFVPSANGAIIPNSAIFNQPAPLGATPQVTNQVTTNNPIFNLAEGLFSDPVARQNLRQFILSVMAEAT